MHATQIPIEEITTSQKYFHHSLKLVEEYAPADAVVSGSLHEVDGVMEATVRITSPNWQSSCRKRDPNPLIAIDKAIEGINHSIQHTEEAKDLVYPLVH